MKYPMILVVGVCLLLTSVPATADQAADEAAIRKLRAQAIEAWNTKNIEILEDIYAEDAWVEEGSKVSAVLKAAPTMFGGEWKNFHIEQLKEIGIVFVTPDVAIFRS